MCRADIENNKQPGIGWTLSANENHSFTRNINIWLCKLALRWGISQLQKISENMRIPSFDQSRSDFGATFDRMHSRVVSTPYSSITSWHSTRHDVALLHKNNKIEYYTQCQWCDEPVQNSHSSNAKFNFQNLTNANANVLDKRFILSLGMQHTGLCQLNECDNMFFPNVNINQYSH